MKSKVIAPGEVPQGTEPGIKQEETVMMSERAKHMLNDLDQFLAHGGKDAEDLWDVITAFRGPDDHNDHSSKGSCTIPIRRAALPEVAKRRDETANAYTGGPLRNVASFCKSASEYKGPKTREESHMNHFDQHAFKAAVALGLVDSPPARKKMDSLFTHSYSSFYKW